MIVKIAVALLSTLLMGCTALKPVGAIEIGYAFPFSTDYWQHSDRSWQCEQPQIRGEIGLETKDKFSFGFYHESMILCGTFNTKPEIFENGFYIKKQWGGWR